jgi:L,D-transpeptidase ErfK/SrfK
VGGATAYHAVTEGDSLVELARRYDLGYNEIIAANPGMDPFLPPTGATVTIPGRWILPDVPEQRGIVINLAEMRMYYFSSQPDRPVNTFPVGIGDEGWETPTGTYRITGKTAHPAWHVPPSIRQQRPELPVVVPPGPDNPLGTHALRLSGGTVMIHGTNRPFSIGRRVSHGCIHLYPEDITVLYRTVGHGTGVTIVQQRVKATRSAERVLVEIHGVNNTNMHQEAVYLLEKKGLLDQVDIGKMLAALRADTGMPTDITK